MTMSPIELLAPAGSLDILKAAVDAGADAVYAGVGAYNARMNACNLTEDELREGCLYAHRRGSKVYLTLNTLVNSSEMDEAVEIASNAYNMGIDGILIQDTGLAVKLHRHYPLIPLHASTQMNIFTDDAFKELADAGIRRVVLPRELSYEEIRKRTREASRYGIETEVFVHGAVCVCYSGLCLFSSMNKSGTRSGNRGMCAQPCRQEYRLSYEGDVIKEGHLISPKDRALIDHLTELQRCGVASLKIEGRMRDKAYVMTVVDSYRKLIDSEPEVASEIMKSVRNELLINFNRGGNFTTQYFTGHKPSDLLSGEYVGKYGLKLGKVIRTDKKQGIIEFSVNRNYPIPAKGDYLSIRNNDIEQFSFPVGKIHEAPGRLVVKGLHPDSIASIKADSDVYLMNHDTVKLTNANSRKTSIKVTLKAEDECVTACAEAISGINKGISGSYDVILDQSYEGHVVPRERIIEQFKKTGDTPYRVEEVIFENDVDIKCPISLINELRRGMIDDLTSSIDYEHEHTCIEEFIPPKAYRNASVEAKGEIKTFYYFPSVRAIKGDLRRDTDIYGFSVYDLALKPVRERIYQFLNSNSASVILVLPDAYHDKLKDVISRASGELKDMFGDRFLGYMDPCVFAKATGGSGHFLSAAANLYNSESLSFASSRADAMMISYELSAAEAIDTLCNSPLDKGATVIIHSGGPIPWMRSDFCPLGAHKKSCRECYEKAVTVLSDMEGRNECFVLSHSADCSSTIYGNAKHTYNDNDAEAIAELGINVIQMFTEI